MAKQKRNTSVKKTVRSRPRKNQSDSPALQEAAARTAQRLDRELSQLGWDQAPSLFALVSTQAVLGESDLEPQVRQQMKKDVEADPQHYTAVLQSLRGNQAEIEDLLTHIWWPKNVEGVALSLERIILPPSAEDEIPTEANEQEKYLTNHPQREDIRLVVVVLRDGTSWCTIRARSFDSETGLAQGPDLVPDLVRIMQDSMRA